jgi:DNA polymerase-3 subunit epsilon
MIKSDVEISKEWAAGILKNENWVILDTETTGLGNDAQIIQIGIITPTLPNGFQAYVKPTVPISIDAQNIHGIKYDDVKQSPYFETVFLDIWKIISNKDVIIYNADFDLALIRQSLRARGIQIAFPTSDRRGCRVFTNGGSIHCAMHYYSQWVGEWNSYHGSYKWQKLPGGDHSALGDCKATLEVIKAMANG